VQAVCFSADGRQLASGCWDGKVRVWDVAGRADPRTFAGHAGTVESVRFDRTGRWVASAGNDGVVRVWDVQTEREVNLWRGRHHAGPQGGFSALSVDDVPEARLFASAGDDGAVRLWPWEGEGGAAPVLRAGGVLRCVAAGLGGRLLAACGADGSLHLVDRSASPPRRRTWRLFGHGGHLMHAVAFSPEGRYVATANPDGTIYLLRLAERGKVPRLPEAPDTMVLERAFEGHAHRGVNAAAVSADGAIAWTACSDAVVRAWQVADARSVHELVHPEEVFGLALAPDGKSVVTGGKDGLLRRWWYLENPPRAEPWKGHSARVDGLAWSGDGKVLVSGSADRSVRVWEVNGKQRFVFRDQPGEVWSVAVDHEGLRALSSDKTGLVKLWDLAKGAALKTWEHEPQFGRRGSSAVCLSADGKRGAWGAGDGTVRVRDLDADKELLRLEVGPRYVRAVAFSPDGGRLLAGSHEAEGDGTLTLWELETGRRLDHAWTPGGVTGIAFTRDGKRAVVSHADGRARVWRMPGP
jgi:WD40 repeat protein